MSDDRYRTVTVDICDVIANDVRIVAAYVSKGVVPPEIDGPVNSLVALVAAIGDAQRERDAREQRINERREYR